MTLITISILSSFSLADDLSTGEPANWPETMHGQVLSSTGDPIAGATVNFRLDKIHEFPSGRWDETIETRTAQTDEHGKYELKTGDLPKLVHRPFTTNLNVTADGYADGKWWSWYARRHTLGPDDSNLATIKLLPGRLVVGRCVDPHGNPVSGAVVKAESEYFQIRKEANVGWDLMTTDEAGRFFLRVPDDRERAIGFWVAHPDWAPQHAVVALDKDQVINIQLQSGGALSGHVQTVDGQPAAGVVVAASSQFDGNLDGMTFPVNLATLTDANGRYQFPHLTGDFRIFLTRAARDQRQLDPEFAVSDHNPPLVVPQAITIQQGKDQTLDFVEPPLVTVQGTIRWPNGDPAPGVEVRTYYLPENFKTGIDIVTTHTNDTGNYSVELPQDMPELGIMVSGANNSEGKWHYAHPGENVDAVRKNTQFITLGQLKKSRQNIDWILRVTY